jgi:uncharacterized cupredoxin-like copper-binding protein
MTASSRLRRAVAVLLALTLTASCSDDDASDDDASEGEATTTTAEHTGPEVAVTAVDFGFNGMPASIAAGTRIVLTNQSAAGEEHQLVAFLVPPSEGRLAAALFQLPPAEVKTIIGDVPAAVTIAAPGEDGEAPAGATDVLTEPGRYVFACFLGTPPHVTQGMLGDVTVT